MEDIESLSVQEVGSASPIIESPRHVEVAGRAARRAAAREARLLRSGRACLPRIARTRTRMRGRRQPTRRRRQR